MSCYAGGIEVSTLTLETWHSNESFYDSLIGKSPLMQLCRMANLARASLALSDFSFHRIGVDTSDTKFATIDYEINTTWNPLYDYKTILSQVGSVLINLFDYQIGSDCYARKYHDDSILATFTSAMVGRSYDLKGDWGFIMNALRDLLDGMEGGDIDVEPWASMTVTPLTVKQTTDRHTGFQYLLEEVIVDTTNDYWVVPLTKVRTVLFGSTTTIDYYNTYPLSTTSVCSQPGDGDPPSLSLSDIDLHAGFKYGSYNYSTNSVTISPSPLTTDRIVVTSEYPQTPAKPGGDSSDVCDQNNLELGWASTTGATLTFRVFKNTGSSEANALLDGVSFDWAVTVTQLKLDSAWPDMEYTCTMSGTDTWGPGDYTDVVIEVTLDDPHMLDEDDLPVHPDIDTSIGGKGLRFSLNATCSTPICTDACGNLHLG